MLYKKILTLNYRIPSDISPFAKDILKNLLITNTKRLGLLQIRAHEFYRLFNHPPSQGIIVGRHSIPVDSNILAETAKIGFDSEYTKECLMTNKHNAQTTAYYLILKQRLETGFQSITDINSKRFDSTLLTYLHSRGSAPRSARHRSKQRSSVDKFLDE